MKNTEFKNFMANIEKYGIESVDVQFSAVTWIALTDNQVQKVIDYALEHGYEPDADGRVKVGEYTLKMTDEHYEQYKESRKSKPAKKGVRYLSYTEFIDLAKTRYCKGGDTYVECWAESDFNYYVEQFGGITKKGAIAMFDREYELEREREAIAEWDSDDIAEELSKEEVERLEAAADRHAREALGMTEDVTLTAEEVEAITASLKKDLEGITTIKGCVDAKNFMHSLYEGARAVTPEMLTAWDLLIEERADVLIAHDTAVKMAKAQKGSGKHMSEKKGANKPAEQPTAPVEVLKGEVIDTKVEKEVNAAIGRISAKIDKIGRGYLEIVGDVARLRKHKAWKFTGHKSMYDLCADKFGMSRATVANLEAIFAKYGDKETYKLTDEAEGLSVRQMLANIKSEKTAELEDKGGESEDGESNGNGGKSGKGGKIETLTSLSIQLGADWSIEEILEEIKAQLTEQNAVYPEGATLTLTITK